MTNSFYAQFHCDNAAQLAVHLACCHWRLTFVPEGLEEELMRIESQGCDLAQELKRLRYRYTEVPA